MQAKIIAITMGDPAGVGAEVIVKAIHELNDKFSSRLIVIGDSRFIRKAVENCNLSMSIRPIASIEEAKPEDVTITVLDVQNADPAFVPYGQISELGGKAAYQYLEIAIQLALKKKVAAVVTAPINKAALNLAGYHYSGHTEIFAKLTNTSSYAMMLVDGEFRVVHATTHVALRKACDLVTKERIYQVIKLAYASGKQMGLSKIRIGVAGLNPHSGEGGLFGDEELKEIIPAIELARAEGITVEGPVPPDTVFVKARSGVYDFAIAMYHDQGHIPLKMAGFDINAAGGSVSGVNVTLGLPIIRTSVDHGTAFDQAGRGRALPPGEAYRLTQEAIRGLPFTSEDILYKKMDSALRGNIGAEIDAILDGITDTKIALVAPALPENHRITCGGYQLIDGIPVHETEMASDPVTPVHESHLPTLLAMTSHYKVGYLPLNTVCKGTKKTSELLVQLMAEGCRIVVADATQNSHLEILSQVCVSYSSVIIPCGTAGLAGTLAQRLFSPKLNDGLDYLKNDTADGTIAAVIGSKSRNASLQINQAILEHKWLKEIEVQRKALSAPESRADEIQRVVENAHRAVACGKRGVIIRFDSDPGIDGASLNAADLAAGLGETARILAECIKVHTFYLSGGDIAIGTVSKLGGWGVTVEVEPEPGVCCGRLQGGKYEGARIITKAGSFGDPGTLARLLQMSDGC